MKDIIGWILVIVGILFLIVGLIEAFRKVTSDASVRTQSGDIDYGKLIEALIKAGLLYVAVGVALIVLGLQLTGEDLLDTEAAMALIPGGL